MLSFLFGFLTAYLLAGLFIGICCIRADKMVHVSYGLGDYFTMLIASLFWPFPVYVYIKNVFLA